MTTQNWITLSAVQVGGALCLPMILIGYEIGKLGFEKALLVIAVGNMILFCLALLSSSMALDNRLTTAENSSQYFGKAGKLFFSIILLSCMCGWFAIQSQVMAQELLSGSAGVLSLLIVLATLWGIRGIAKLANFAVPLMVITLVIALWHALANPATVVQETGSISQGISLVIAASILAVVDLPTFFRHARDKTEGLKASIAIFLVGIPLVELCGVLLHTHSTGSTITHALGCIDHPLWRSWIWIFILICGWTTNNTNLYSAAMSLKALCPKLSEQKAIVTAGLFCVLLSLLPLLERLTLVLELMGVFVASMGAIVLTAYYLGSTHVRLQSIAWAFGAIFGTLSLFMQIGMSGIAVFDAALTSACTLLLIRGYHEKVSYN